MDWRPDPLWRERPARTRKRVLLISAVAVAAYVAYVSVNAPGSCSAPGGGPCNAAGPQVVIHVTPRQPLALATCVRRERAYHEAGERLINQACRPGRADWYHAVVTYRGRDAAWVACVLVGYDAVGTRLWPRQWIMPLTPAVSSSPVPAVLRMHGGQTITVDYHLPGMRHGGPPGPVARYVGHCQTYTAEPELTASEPS
jgi:hypothetical protein